MPTPSFISSCRFGSPFSGLACSLAPPVALALPAASPLFKQYHSVKPCAPIHGTVRWKTGSVYKYLGIFAPPTTVAMIATSTLCLSFKHYHTVKPFTACWWRDEVKTVSSHEVSWWYVVNYISPLVNIIHFSENRAAHNIILVHLVQFILVETCYLKHPE